ncbi:UPF0158 family protein [Delftia tsuruhatensis]|uniref:UPF0158 family protein n=1 Tax=Delftia tsuruhatensis TaxID=180282 RepID=UPI001AE19B6B|nr:UPF0158 family protein [Delftia tsuruhatensis]MDH0776467.1 UPF0158 family protein [Delftia tsuruhatensis]MDH1459978.1 UPF0158 family protein [Delftia tsuruhatensis]MDH1822941.1 UPF0158 family protein [Delftia tsuruhatensis]WGG12151.1 UPF0158 family protein [Delftia tsuruhatensis]
MDNVWQELINQALTELVERTGAPAPGAKLRAAIAHLARQRGLDFPPTGVRKFTELVEAFPADFILQRRPGSDVVVVPAARAELLAVEQPGAAPAAARIRQDIFEALTKVPVPAYGMPYYEPVKDLVLWLREGEQPPQTAVPMPATTLEEELALRTSFIDEVEPFEVGKDALSTSLQTTWPLRNFSNAIQEFGLVRKWHVFRVARLAMRLREWSVRTGLTWQPSWVDATEPRPNTAAPAAPVSLDNKRHLLGLSSLLTEEDLTRISVPMDIVLRLLAKK